MRAAPMCYTLIVYIDPKEQLLAKQDMIKYHKSHKISQKNCYKRFPKLLSTLKAPITIDFGLGKRLTTDFYQRLQGNALKTKVG